MKEVFVLDTWKQEYSKLHAGLDSHRFDEAMENKHILHVVAHMEDRRHVTDKVLNKAFTIS